jgi:hypothetical protein
MDSEKDYKSEKIPLLREKKDQSLNKSATFHKSMVSDEN